MTLRRLVGPALLACVVALAVAGCSGGDQTQAVGGDGQGYVAGDGSVTTIPVADRQPAPALRGTTLDGSALDLASMRGKVVVLNVWGSWCADCRSEAKALEAVYRQTRSHGVEFVGINTRDNSAGAQAYERTFGISYPSLVDDGGSLLLAFSDTVPPSAIPSTLVIDRQGRVAARTIGATTFTDLRSVVLDVANEPS
ncbi:MAG: TlpA disulfide reductase family protein [Actinomycetes bacterium]